MQRRSLVVGLSLALLFAACGDDVSDTVAEAAACEGEFPVTVTASNGEVEVERCPERIVSLSPTGTEMLFAVGAGEQVVAVDDQSNFPAEAPMTDLSGFTPNVEAIAERDPDLVVMANDTEGAVDGLEALGIPVLLHEAAATFDDTYEQITQLGRATGHAEEAREVNAGIKSGIDDLVASIPELDEPPTYYHELDDTFFTVTSKTFIGEVYGLAGLENIADPADDGGGGYPQLSAEYIVEADPDFVFLADTKCCSQTVEKVAQRPGWGELTAVEEGRVVLLDDDIASRWGPRVVDFLETVVRAVETLAA